MALRPNQRIQGLSEALINQVQSDETFQHLLEDRFVAAVVLASEAYRNTVRIRLNLPFNRIS